ncbi:hypothetical protein CHK_3028 [Christensenella hongkongensis]|uniref:Uncharacterized protein n=1 Tax=Christensenella hongkongensis TaxID=270498 RepID=A0A0M2NGP0_9FIRM|nr:hypothetical protein CHK_3028 [Christensenella hongkongensis]
MGASGLKETNTAKNEDILAGCGEVFTAFAGYPFFTKMK